MKKFNSSQLELASECPRCFWLEVNFNLKRPLKGYQKTTYPEQPEGLEINKMANIIAEMKDMPLPGENCQFCQYRDKYEDLF